MKTLLTYLAQQRRDAVLAPLFKMLEAVFELIVPLIVAQMIDIGIRGNDRGALVRGLVLLILLALVGFASAATAQYFSARCATKLAGAMRGDLFAHITRLPFSTLDRAGSAGLITRMTSDINQLETAVNMFLRLFLRSPFIVAGAVVMALLTGGRAAIPFLVLVPVLALVISLISFGTLPLYRSVQARLDAVLLAVRENLRGIRVVRAFSGERDEMRRFRRENHRLYSEQLFSGRISALLAPVCYVCVNLGILAVLRLGGRQVDAGVLTQGRVIALVNYLSQILVELIKLANLIILLSRGAASMRRIDEVFAMPAEEEAGDANFPRMDAPRAIAVDGLCFTYPGGKRPALSDVSFVLRRGETLGIIGGTGAGKTTLLALLARFYRADSGSIRIGERDLQTIRTAELRSHIGIVPQESALFSGTLRDNLLFGGKKTEDAALMALLEVAQAADFVGEKGQGLSLPVEQGGRNFSGGQQQRIAIARALALAPDILMLDDAASALDVATDARLRRALRTHTAGRTVLLVSQRVSSVRDADRILVLDGGRQAGFGTHRELLASCEIYRELCRSQMSEDAYRKEVAG